MELLLVYFFLLICLLLSAWDIFTGIVGISAEMSRIPYSPNIVELFGDLIKQKPAYVVMGVFFSLFVVMSDYLLMKAYEAKKSGIPINKTWIYSGLVFWTMFKVIDFQTTVVGTAQILGVQLQEGANIIDVWKTVGGNSWTQMLILIAASLMITSAHIGVAVFLKIIELLNKPKPLRKP
jgi:hypothetical protein